MTQPDRDISRLSSSAEDLFRFTLLAAQRGADFDLSDLAAMLETVKSKTRETWSARVDMWRKA